MNPFDSAILDYINRYSQLSGTFDAAVVFISRNALIKGGVLLTIFWWGWFRVDKYNLIVRVHLVSTLIGCFIAITAARTLEILLPFRFRPLHEEGLDFTLPYGMESTVLESWSSFPSDHAVLYYALSAGMFYISKRVGIFALVYTTLIIGLPRVYLGLHYPTDIIGGAFIGIVTVLSFNSNVFIEKIAQPVLNMSTTKPEVFYPVLFLVAYQIVDMFDSSRAIVVFFISAIKAIVD